MKYANPLPARQTLRANRRRSPWQWARWMAATALLDQAAKNSRGVPMNPAPRSDAQPTDSGEREMQLKRHLEDVERVRQGHLIRTAPMWLTVLCPDASSIVDYLQDPIVLIDQPDQLPVRAKAKRDAFLEEWADAERRGDGFDAQRNLLFTYEDFYAAMSQHTVLTISDLTRGQGQFRPVQVLPFQFMPSRQRRHFGSVQA